MLDRLLSIVAPHPCLGCGKLGSPLCHSCKEDIVSRHLNSEVEALTGLDATWVVGVRSGLLQKVVGAYKFTPMRAAAKPLASLLREVVSWSDGVLVPIPTTTGHIRERGFDHISVLVKEMRRPSVSLIQRKRSAQQKHASRDQRFAQAEESFELGGVIDPTYRYVLVDDVITTGATIQAAARLLRAGGARYVACAVLAYQPLD